MSSFSYLNQVNVTANNTKEFPLDDIRIAGKTPVLIVAPATESNKEYTNDLLRFSLKNKSNTRKNITADDILQVRKNDRILYAKHVIKGWIDVIDDSGKEAEFNLDNCQDFVNSLPDWLFDKIRNFCNQSETFIDNFDIEVTTKK